MNKPPFGSVYRITCEKTGKVYIGLTRDYVSNRWYQHKKAAATGCSSALYQAMRKHGIESFSIDQIASAVSPEQLGRLERELIEQYNAYGHGGYNMSRGGEQDIARTMTEHGRERLRAARNRPKDRAENRQRQIEWMATVEGKMHQARMVESAKACSFKVSAARRAYAKTEAGAKQIAMAAKAGAARKAELSSKPLMADGKRFSSVKDAADAYGIERGAIRWRIKSPHFESWAWA